MELLEKVEQSGKWPQQTCTMMFVLIPKNVTSERPIVLIPTLIRWWEALTAPEVAKWQQKYRVVSDATDCRNGAQQTVWENLMEMGRFNGNAKEKTKEWWLGYWTSRRLSSVSASLWFGPGQHTSASQGRSCECFAVFFSGTRGGVQHEGCAAKPSRLPARVQVEFSVLGRRNVDRKMKLRAKRSLDEADSRGSNVETGERTQRSSDA